MVGGGRCLTTPGPSALPLCWSCASREPRRSRDEQVSSARTGHKWPRLPPDHSAPGLGSPSPLVLAHTLPFRPRGGAGPHLPPVAWRLALGPGSLCPVTRMECGHPQHLHSWTRPSVAAHPPNPGCLQLPPPPGCRPAPRVLSTVLACPLLCPRCWPARMCCPRCRPASAHLPARDRPRCSTPGLPAGEVLATLPGPAAPPAAPRPPPGLAPPRAGRAACRERRVTPRQEGPERLPPCGRGTRLPGEGLAAGRG